MALSSPKMRQDTPGTAESSHTRHELATQTEVNGGKIRNGSFASQVSEFYATRIENILSNPDRRSDRWDRPYMKDERTAHKPPSRGALLAHLESARRRASLL